MATEGAICGVGKSGGKGGKLYGFPRARVRLPLLMKPIGKRTPRFSLRAFLVLVTLCALASGYIPWRRHQVLLEINRLKDEDVAFGVREGLFGVPEGAGITINDGKHSDEQIEQLKTRVQKLGVEQIDIFDDSVAYSVFDVITFLRGGSLPSNKKPMTRDEAFLFLQQQAPGKDFGNDVDKWEEWAEDFYPQPSDTLDDEPSE